MRGDTIYLYLPVRAIFWTAVSLLLFCSAPSHAAQVSLAWDASATSVDGYQVFMRTKGQTYDYGSPVWSGTTTTCSIDQLEDNTYYFVARAYDGDNQSANSNEVEYEVVVNTAPESDAGTDQAVSAGTRVTLDGSGSTDADGTISSYRWTQTEGPTVSLSSTTSRQTAFTAPAVTESTALGFQLSVTDNDGLADTDACQVTVLPVVATDSDNDGLSDDEESSIYGTDPSRADTDGDGTPDGQEVSLGTDPTVADSAGEIIYEDAEDKTTSGWDIYDKTPSGAFISNVYDQERGSMVIELSGTDMQNGFRLRNEDGSKWQNSTNFVIQWSMNVTESFKVYIDVETTDGHRYIQYEPVDVDGLGTGEYIRHGLGKNILDGEWHTFTQDLHADLQQAQPDLEIIEINGFWIRGSGKLDDIKLQDSMASDATDSGSTDTGFLYEDAEDKTTSGWDIYDKTPSGASISNVYDPERGSMVIELSGTDIQNGFRLRNEDGSKWQNSTNFVIEWSMKTSESFVIYIDVETTDGHRYIQYEPVDADRLGSGEYVRYGIGTDATSNQWITFTRDIQMDLEDAQSGTELIEVNGFWIRGSGKLDDIILF